MPRKSICSMHIAREFELFALIYAINLTPWHYQMHSKNAYITIACIPLMRTHFCIFIATDEEKKERKKCYVRSSLFGRWYQRAAFLRSINISNKSDIFSTLSPLLQIRYTFFLLSRIWFRQSLPFGRIWNCLRAKNCTFFWYVLKRRLQITMHNRRLF